MTARDTLAEAPGPVTPSASLTAADAARLDELLRKKDVTRAEANELEALAVTYALDLFRQHALLMEAAQ